MRIGVYLGKVLPPTIGGGSVFQEEVVHELIRQNRDFELYFYYFGKMDIPLCGSNVRFIKLNQILSYMDYLYTPKDLLYFMLFGIKRRYSFLNKILIRDSIQLMYFPTPSYFVETETPYLFTMWDLGDKVLPYFPETSMKGRNFELRKSFYEKALPKAMFIFIGNEIGKRQLMDYYSVGGERIVKNPMVTPNYIYSVTPDERILEKYGLSKGKYLFYPAQFWPHKNHINLLRAMVDLSKKGYRLVLSGSDQGNLNYIKSKVSEFGLDAYVVFAGFLSQEEIVGLYKNAFALVYASIMGPDNIPPLEAMGLDCPVICAEYDGAKEQLKDAALFFNPYDADKIVEDVNRLENDRGLKETLVQRGKELAKIYSIENYVSTVYDTFHRTTLIRECWG